MKPLDSCPQWPPSEIVAGMDLSQWPLAVQSLLPGTKQQELRTHPSCSAAFQGVNGSSSGELTLMRCGNFLQTQGPFQVEDKKADAFEFMLETICAPDFNFENTYEKEPVLLLAVG